MIVRGDYVVQIFLCGINDNMILHCGEALTDFIPTTDSEGNSVYRPVPGGSPFNTAIAASRLGVRNFFLGKISRDFFGEQLVDRFKESGVNLRYTARTDQPSTLAFVKKSESGEAEYAFFKENAADRSLLPEDLPGNLDESISCIQFGSVSLLSEPTASTIVSFVEREHERRVVSLDPNIRTILIDDEETVRKRLLHCIELSTIVKLSEEDLVWLIPGKPWLEAARFLMGPGTSLVVLTRGRDGSVGINKGGLVPVPAVPVRVSDTVGAGDSFHAAFLVWLADGGLMNRKAVASLTQEQLQEMLRFAAGAAAITCSRPGADPPVRSEIDRDVV